MDEEYDVIVLGTGLTVSNAFGSLRTRSLWKQIEILPMNAPMLIDVAVRIDALR